MGKDYIVVPSIGHGEVRFDGRSFRRVLRNKEEEKLFMESMKREQKKIIEDLIRQKKNER